MNILNQHFYLESSLNINLKILTMKTKYLIYSVLLGALIFGSCEKEKDDTPETIFRSGTVEGVWKKNSKIIVNGHLIVPEGKSLTIEDGVKVIVNDTTMGIEILVYGNLYSKGTPSNPVIFTVADSLKSKKIFPRLWGGILCGPTSEELFIDNTIIEYTGFVTTEESPSVKAGFFKAKAGEGLPAINFKNTNGKVVIMNSVFRNLGEDCFYLEGGNIIITNNVIYTQGETGGDAINLKSGCIADICFNLIYSPNTNGLKLSNSGDRTPQCHVVAYNNTIVNAGWRRPTVKGGSIWLESGVYAELWNNMIVNCRFGIKNNSKDPADNRSIYDYTYYYGYTQECVDNFQSGIKDVVRGNNDIAATLAQQNDPLFENYPLDTDLNNAVFNTNWDFHLKLNSPALSGGKTNFTRNFATNGVVVEGKTYYSPEPKPHFGAYGTK